MLLGVEKLILRAVNKNYTPELTFTDCLFSCGKGSEAALIRHLREYWGRLAEHGEHRRNHDRVRGSTGGVRRSAGRASGNSCIHSQSAEAGSGPLCLGYSCQFRESCYNLSSATCKIPILSGSPIRSSNA
jgi:hypothetical protein